MAYSDNFVDDLLSLVDDLVTADKMELSEMLYEKSFGESNIADSHTVVEGVRHGHVVPILKDTPDPESFPFVDETSCDATECDVEHEFSNMSWELGLIECRVPICLRTFNENFLRFFNSWRHTQEGEPDLNQAIIQFINGKFERNLTLAQWRVAYFGDKSSASAYFNGVDGFWAQAEANSDLVIDITENGGATFADQAFASGEDVYDYLIAMYDLAAEYPWFDDSRLEYRVTRSMGVKLVTWLNKLGKKAPMNCDCYDADAVTRRNVFSLNGLTINGIPVLVHSEFDDIINYSTELNGGGGAAARVNPHRAILTFRENLLIGTSQRAALESFDIWYSKDDKKVYLEGSAYMGSAIPLDEYVVATAAAEASA